LTTQSGQVVLVTGGRTGIGLAIAREALARGALVSVCGRTVDAKAPIVEPGVDATRYLAVKADVSQENAVEAWFAATLQRFGRIDAVINNAAISAGRLLVSTEMSDWDRVMATNATGAFLVARHAVRAFLRARRGVLINIGSLAQYGSPANATYAVSKAVLDGLTKAIAARYGSAGIRSHLVVAGFVDTQLTRDLPEVTRKWLIETCPQRRPATPREIAVAALDLAGPPGRAINGRAVHVAGGLTGIPG
jgi:3-oxoacyl-[acyl-carrier protein] reductase